MGNKVVLAIILFINFSFKASNAQVTNILFLGDSHSTDKGAGLGRELVENSIYKRPAHIRLKVIALCGASPFWFIKGGIEIGRAHV